MDAVSDNTGIKAILPVGERLQHAVITATNDDYSEVGSEKRARHIERLTAMQDAHAELNRLYEIEAAARSLITNIRERGMHDNWKRLAAALEKQP